MNSDNENRVSQITQEIQAMNDHPHSVIEETASRLEVLNYSPPVNTSLPAFLRLTQNTLLEEIDTVMNLPENDVCARIQDGSEQCEDIRVQVISVLLFYYKQLYKLRDGDGEAWDDIDEIYVHD